MLNNIAKGVKIRRMSYVFVLCLMMGALFSCAQISSPQGGPQDSLPPIVLDMNPMPYQTNFDGKKIIIKFDEYVQLKDQQKQFTMSPPAMGGRPILTVKGKSIEVQFEEPLDSATTYKLDFGNSIVDFNESNPLSGFSMIFSTGDYIDSLIMVGQTIDALSQDSVIGALMYFYDPIKELYRDSVRLEDRRKQASKDSLENIKKMQIGNSSSAKRKGNKNAISNNNDGSLTADTIIIDDLLAEDTVPVIELDEIGQEIENNEILQSDADVSAEDSSSVAHLPIANGVIAMDSMPKLDSMLFLGRPEALFRTDSSGIFFADILKDKNYRIYAVQDNNGNQTYDPGADLVGFIDATFNPTQMPGFTAEVDSLTGRLMIDSLQLRFELFKEEAVRRQVMLKQQRPMRAMIQLSFAAPNALIDTLELDGIDSSWIVRKFNAAHDTLNIWINTPNRMEFDSLADTIKGRVVYQRHDSVWNLQPYSQKLSLVNKRPTPESSKGKKKKDREDRRAQEKEQNQHERDSIINQEEIMYSQEPDQLPDTVGASPLVELRKTDQGLEATNVGLSDGDESQNHELQTEHEALVKDSIAVDSTHTQVAKEKKENPFKVSVSASQTLNPIKSIGFVFEYPLEKLDSSRVSLIHLKRKEKKGKSKRDQKEQEAEIEEIPVSLHFVPDSINPLQWTIRAPWEQGEEYQLLIPDSVFVDYAHHANDTLQQKFTIDSQDKYGMFTVNLKSNVQDSLSASKEYIVELITGKGDKIKVLDRRTGVKINQTEEFKFIKPENYRLRVIEDKNGNKKWDTGVLTKGIQPEKVRFWYNESTGSQVLIAKENWEVEVPVDVDLLFAQ